MISVRHGVRQDENVSQAIKKTITHSIAVRVTLIIPSLEIVAHAYAPLDKLGLIHNKGVNGIVSNVRHKPRLLENENENDLLHGPLLRCTAAI
jgi:hypothetical protein